MRSLKERFQELLGEISIERTYNLSYDAVNNEKKFVNPNNNEEKDDARTYILRKLKKFKAKSIESPCASTIIFIFEDENFDLISFKNELEKDFYIFISLIDDRYKNRNEAFNYNNDLDKSAQSIWKSLQ